MNDFLQVFLLSMLPVGELRLAIPIGMAIFKLNLALVYLTAVAGNLIPIYFILFAFRRVSEFIAEKSKTYTKLYEWWSHLTLGRHSKKIDEYGFWGLLLFVGIPLPFTGAYTGALLAVLMNFPLKRSIPAISLGVIMSGIIVTLLVVLGFNIEDNLVWQLIVAALLLGVAIWWYLKNRKKRKQKNTVT